MSSPRRSRSPIRRQYRRRALVLSPIKEDIPDVPIPESCFDVFNLDEKEINDFLSNPDHGVFIYETNIGWVADCFTFRQLFELLSDQNGTFYECKPGTRFEEYARNPRLTKYTKLPLSRGNVLVKFNELGTKYATRTQKIYMIREKELEKTISFGASLMMNFVGAYHCQEGSNQTLYKIL